jgi:hypothetical protein
MFRMPSTIAAGRRAGSFRHAGIMVCLLVTGSAWAAPAQWWPEALEAALSRAGTNRSEMVRALESAPPAQREGLQFLLENMPRPDLQTLSAAHVLENLALAYEALASAPWAKTIPRELFFNDVLPYACLDERRDAWRKPLRELCLPLVKDCKTPGEAAQRLNQKLFGLVKVKYSTQRRKAQQSPLESMESGLATCTGLSILLVEACRSVGVPARVAGIPLWPNHSGNHTWVEIWDQDWHFAGAAEPDPNGLDRGWFRHNASQAERDTPEHAIYASSYRRTGLAYPLPWNPWATFVSAVNVTDRYAAPKPAVTGQKRLLVKVLDRPNGRRVAAKVTVTDAADGAARWEGTSRGETADLNDILPIEIPQGHTYRVRVELDGRQVNHEFRAESAKEEMLVLSLENAAPVDKGDQAKWPFPRLESQIARYTAYHIKDPIKIDGRLTEAAWQQAPRSPRFTDILTGEPALYDTRASVLWDDENLYVAFRVEEPFVRARFTTNNSPVYFDNDVEVFIAGRDAYFEFEINGFNTTYEVFFIWEDAYHKGGFDQAPEFARSRLQPFNGVDFKTHPRGGRLGAFDWHFPNKQTAVFIDGTLNKDDDRDRGWTVELAFPWKGMQWLAKADGRALPPKEGDVWRMDFSRFNTYKAPPPAKDSGGWFWSPHGVWDSHIPELFPYIRFTTNDVTAAQR